MRWYRKKRVVDAEKKEDLPAETSLGTRNLSGNCEYRTHPNPELMTI
jgi:hypothetical protein